MANPNMAHVPRLIESIISRARNVGSGVFGNARYAVEPPGDFRESLVGTEGSALAPRPPSSVEVSYQPAIPTTRVPMQTQAPAREELAAQPMDEIDLISLIAEVNGIPPGLLLRLLLSRGVI